MGYRESKEAGDWAGLLLGSLSRELDAILAERVYRDLAVREGAKRLYLGSQVAFSVDGENSRLTNLSQRTRLLPRVVGVSLVRSCYCPAHRQQRES